MMFVLTGHFRAGAEARRQAIHEGYNEHLRQRAAHVRFGGPLFDEAGRRSGVLLVVEVADRAAADAFLQASPYQLAGLYERTEVAEIRPEVGYPR